MPLLQVGPIEATDTAGSESCKKSRAGDKNRTGEKLSAGTTVAITSYSVCGSGGEATTILTYNASNGGRE